MDRSNPVLPDVQRERLTDAEAEAVLLALGPQLEWSATQSQVAMGPGGQMIYRLICEARTSADHLYAVREEDDYWTATFYGETFYATLEGHPEVCESLFSAEPDAKAACERHHATGKW